MSVLDDDPEPRRDCHTEGPVLEIYRLPYFALYSGLAVQIRCRYYLHDVKD